MIINPISVQLNKLTININIVFHISHAEVILVLINCYGVMIHCQYHIALILLDNRNTWTRHGSLK